MERLSFGRVMWEYFKQRRWIALLFAAAAGLFWLVFTLYDLPAEPVQYTVLLCLFVGAVAAGFDFARFLSRHRKLEALRQEIALGLDGLPSPRNLTEQDYTVLLELMHEDKIRSVSHYDNMQSDMVDYYTLWAHQIKTPIAAMHLLLSGEDSNENAELSSELFKIEQYVEMVLSYLRLDGGAGDLVLKLHHLDDIVRQAVRKYASQFIRRKIKLVYHEMDCIVLTDEKWLVFAIEQVLSNALKYTMPGGTVTVSLVEATKQLCIADTGIGIAPEDLPRVCEKGFTGYNGHNDKKSTGIGLYLCKRILTKLSHTIAIESEPGRGTVVKIGLETLDLTVE